MPRKKTDPDKRPLGFSCPVCKIELRVVHTNKRAVGIVSRIRECEVCGYIQPTEERPRTPTAAEAAR